MLAPFREGFFGIACKLEHVVGRLQPAVHPGIGIVQKFVELGFLLVDCGFLSGKFFLAYFTGGTHIDKSIELAHARFIIFLLIGEDRVAIGRFSSVFVLQPLHCPAMEFFRRPNFGQRAGDLLFHFFYFNTFLGARSFALGAVIIRVVVNIAILVFLGLVFGRYHASTFTAPNHTGVREGVCFRLWLTASA